MWLYYWYFHLLLWLSNISLVTNNAVNDNFRKVKEKDNTVFSEVIRNISRVNNVLQELIENYEHIQNMYKSKSFESSDISTESEIDQVFKEAAKENRKTKSISNETRKEILFSTNKIYPATQMFVSEEEEEVVTEKSFTNDINNVDKISKEMVVESLQDQESNDTDINSSWFLNVETQKWEKSVPGGDINNTTQENIKVASEEEKATNATKEAYKNYSNNNKDKKLSTKKKSHDLKEDVMEMNAKSSSSMESDNSGQIVTEYKNITLDISSEVPEEQVAHVTYMPYYSDIGDKKTTNTVNEYHPKIKKADANDMTWYNADSVETKETKVVIEDDKIESDADKIDKENEIFFNNTVVKKMPQTIQLRGPNTDSIEDKHIDASDSKAETGEPFRSKVVYRDHKHSDEIKVPDNVFYDNVMKNSKNSPIQREQQYSLAKQKLPTVIDNDEEEKAKERLMISLRSVEEILSSTNVPEKKVQQVIHSEVFNGEQIWKDIAQKRPVKLRSLKNTEDIKSDKEMEEQNYLNNNNPALIITTESNDTAISDASHSMSDDDKEMLQTQALRKAYGDACLKVVIKKCYKACKQVSKSVCSLYKCKTAHKETFRQNSKTGCITNFKTNTQTNTEANVEIDNEKTIYIDSNYDNREFVKVKNNKRLKDMKSSDDSDSESLRIKDLPRSGLEGCYPFLNPQTSINNITDPTKDKNLQLNILRDRYERACQKASASKCYKACAYAYKVTCTTHICQKNQQKAYKKACRKQCKAAYMHQMEMDKKSSSDDSDSDDDNDDSDSI